MKVLVVGTGGSIVSGISTVADQMARVLDDTGHSAERLNAGERMRRRSNRLNIENVRAVLSDAVALARRTRRGSAKVVWIHTFGVPTLPALRALAIVAAARLTGCPVVLHFHAFGLERTLQESGRPLRIALRSAVTLASATVVLHEEAAYALRRVTGRSSVHVLPNWVDVPDDVAPLPPVSPLRLVFVGGLVRRKGAPQLMEAMRELGDMAVTVRMVGGAGEDGPAALDRLRAGASDLVATGQVTFAGEQDADGVRSELEAGHVLVLPSEAEGTPMAMLEAMAVGRPVLVTDAGNMRSVVEEEGCGWILPDRDPATIAKYVQQVAADPASIELAATRARRAATDRYSASARGADIDAILASVAKP